MCADQHNLKPPADPQEAQASESNPKKVRSSRYDWAHDLPVPEAGDKGTKKKIAARSSLFARIRNWLREFFRSGGGNPFGRDDDADPMAA